MRKYQQRQILDLLQKTKQAQSSGLYADCQDAVSAIYDFIESIKGEGTQTAVLLKDYYEALFKANNGEIDSKDLIKHLFKIENCIKDELKPDRIEIAFLSYNASMSDSIESIYLAAKDDPNCDPYWIPIPWFERNSDGSLGTPHFEGSDCYSNNIECTDWESYDIAARHPDVIVSFAPYDANNFVTTVHPDFYFERLRNLTDMLVYVPYFVVDENAPLPDHFCTLPGCVYAHTVIVQSEKIRNTYIHAFKKAYGNKFGNPKDKFVALGSPKFDKVINTKKEDCNLPDEWHKIINGRKVIFYNTSIGSLLAGNEQYLNKLRHVLETFKNRDDVALWWRPHPLNEATYKSMRPQLLNDYKQIISNYINDGWGIYDDTSDLHRAIALTDAYYGDGGSLLMMYGLTGKPVMIQNHAIQEHLDDMDKYTACFECFIDYDGAYWVSAYHFNGLFRIDKKTLEPQYMGSFPGEDIDQKRLFSFAVKIKDDIYFCPMSAKSIAKYSIATGEFSSIELPKSFFTKIKSYRLNWKFSKCSTYNNMIFFFGLLYPDILCYDSSTGEFSNIEGIDKQIDSNSIPFFAQVHVCGKYTVATLQTHGRLLVLDMESKSAEIIFISKSELGFIGICFDGKNNWITPKGPGSLLCWNRETRKAYAAVPLPPSPLADSGNLSQFVTPVIYKNEIFLFPHYHNVVLRFDPISRKLQTVTDLSKALLDNRGGGGKVKLAWTDNQFIYIFSENYPFLFKYSPDTGVETIDLTIKKDDEFIIKNKIVYQKCKKYFESIIYENDKSALLEYLAFAMFDNGDNGSRQKAYHRHANINDSSAGKNIFQKIKSQLC